MRKILLAGVLALGLLAITACEPTEPAMTITAAKQQPACFNDGLEGTVTPPMATTEVVLQRTVGGKWVDWKWYDGTGQGAHVIRRPVSYLGYDVPYETESPSGAPLKGTIHLRVRSAGGSRFSNGVYVTYPKAC